MSFQNLQKLKKFQKINSAKGEMCKIQHFRKNGITSTLQTV